MPPRVLLLFPPPSDPAQPYASLPVLTAYLRAHDVDVSMADLNIEAVHHLLSPQHLRARLDAVTAWLEAAEVRDALDALEADRYLRTMHAAIFGAATVAKSTQALGALRRRGTYASMTALCAEMDVVDAAYRLVSAACYPVVSTRHKLDPAVDIWNPAVLRELTFEPEATPFHRWLSRRVTGLVESHRPDLVGVSLTFPDQLPLAFAALAAVRAADPGIVTCLGGATAGRLATRVGRLGDLLRLVDAVVVGEGEAALLELARRAGARESLAGVPNSICTTGGSPITGPMGRTVPMDTLPTPAYEEMDLGAYLAPEPVLLVNGSRACYWGRCKFCDVSGTASETYRQRSLERVIADFRELHRTTGARHFMFGDLAIAPDRLARLADRLREERLDVRWLCQARLEPRFTAERIQRMAAGGCRLLVFGLESASQRMLDRMAKGTQFADTERILDECAAAGIAINLQTFVGFPGETEEEARETARFVIGKRRAITSVSLTSFKLIEGTAAFEHAPSLGLAELRQLHGTLDVLWDYDVQAGLTAARADALVRELQEALRRAFPAVDKGLSWNAHALLLVSRNGPDGLWTGDATAVPTRGALRPRPGVVMRRLPFHVGELAEVARRADTAGSSYGTRQRRLREVDLRIPRHPTWTLLDPDTPRAVPVSDAVADALVSGVDASRIPGLVLSGLDRLRVTAELIKLLDAGLLVVREPAVSLNESAAPPEVTV
jgi:anaerobic magnesium-protoporphyrin IX monomethyl ester cyclase